MEIRKFKKVGKNKYKILFDTEELTLYEDIILKYELLIKKEITLDDLDKIIKDNNDYDAYNMALNYIEVKMRNRKELYLYLSKKGFEKSLINETISKIEKLGLLDNKAYIKAYINDKVNLTLDGPYKIKKSLIDLDFNENDIDNYLNTFDDKVWKSKIEKLINKKKSIMKNKSYYMFIQKIKNDLYNMGYDSYMIDDKLKDIKYESNALENDYKKACKKYDDETKIINYLLRKGYSYEEIKTLTKM
jgi:regulatory protein